MTSTLGPGFLRRVGSSRRARLAGRSFGYWTLAAAIVGATLATHRWAEEAARDDSSRAETVSRVELAQRAVLNALDGARSDLHLLAAMGVVGEYVRAPDPVRRAALARDIFAFMATRDWCQRVVVAAGGSRVAAERQSGPPGCDALAGVTAGFPSSEALLAVVRSPAAVRLCLGLPLGKGSDGAQGALLAEADPRSLFAGVPLVGSGAGGVFLREAQGEWLLPPDGAAAALELRPVRLTSWSGPAAGTWQLAVRREAGQPPPALLKHDVALTVLLLLASAAGALALARASEARRRAEAEARSQLALFQSVSDNVPSPIYLKDTAGRYLGCNAAFETLVGRPREAILGRDMKALLPAGTTQAHEEADRAILADGMSRQYETRVLAPNGRARDLLVSKAAVRDEDGRLTGLTAALLDITERKAAERELRRSLEALHVAKEAAEAGTRAKSDFLAMMSHEMRTPLHAVLGATGLLLDGQLDAGQREQAAMARTAGQALLELIDDLLDFSRIEAGRLDLHRIAFDVHSLVSDTVALVAGRASAKRLELVCVIDEDVPPRASGDPGRLRQVLLNLLANAIEFTERGSVRARVTLARRDAQGVVLRLSVSDTGLGIPADFLPRLFEPFAQGENLPGRTRTSTGLGLAMTRRLVELMGGAIEVTSTPGQGTEFTCTMRLGDASTEQDQPATPVARTPAHDRSLKVLLVDDNRVNQRVSCALLSRLGCEVDVANDGREALEAVSRRAYDVVFMDCRMPGMSGYDAAREIRRREGQGPHVPIVALTANALHGDRERCLAAGMSDYLAKPVDLASLERVLARRGAPHDELPRPASTPQQAALVDPQALASLRTLEQDGPGFLATLVREFEEGARQRLGDMQLALRGGDSAGLRGAAHSLKGSAGIFGASGIAELCRRIEALADDGAPAEAAPLVSRLAREHEAVMSVLHEAAASV